MQGFLLLYNSFLVVLVDHHSSLAAVLLDRPNEQLIRRLLDAFPKRLSVFEHSHILQILRAIAAITMRVSVFELSLINKLRREQQSFSLRSWQSGDVIANGAIIDHIIGVNNQRVLGVDVVIVDGGSDDDGRTDHGAIFDIEEAIPDGPISADIAIEVEIVLGRLVPVQVLLLATVHHIKLRFCIAGGVLILSKSILCCGWIWIEVEMGLKVDIIGQNSPTSLFQMQLLQIVTPMGILNINRGGKEKGRRIGSVFVGVI